MNTWSLKYNNFDPEHESLREALCTLGNGYFGTRGALPEMHATKVHYPGTYIAGVYNTLPTDIVGRTIYNEDFVNCPNWLMFQHKVNGDPWFDRKSVKILSWKTELNMKKGVLVRRIKWQDHKKRITSMEQHVIVSMAHPHCGALKCTITPENYNGKITIRSGIDGLINNANVDRYKQLNSKHLEPCSHGAFGKDGIYLQMQTTQSKVQITEAIRTLVYKGSKKINKKLNVIAHGRQRMFHEFSIDAKKGEKYTVEKLLSIYTSRDHGVADHCSLAQETVSKIENFASLDKMHEAKWSAFWKKFDIEIKGDDFVQLVLRLHTFHLLQSASTYNEDIDAGMPVRGLHGEAYRGHIFWDELYVFPFYNLRAPEISRALLMYRYRRLGAAKENAQQHGYKGAMYPWQTASTGDEQTQIIHLNPLSGHWGPDYSSLQRHVSIAVAYNTWTYYYTSGDHDFLDRYGAEMIVEIAHFWATIAKLNKNTKRYEIDGVMGPDEFHEKYPGAGKGGIKNNTYTNAMAVWVIERALHILNDLLEDEDRNALLIKTEITEKEVDRWKDIICRMTIPMGDDGILHQFEGYMDLKELDWDGYRERYSNIHRIDRILKAEGLSPDSYKVAKQADTLMLFYLLNFNELKALFKRNGYPFTKQIMKKNFNYYFSRVSHGSTLSKVVHAYVAEILGITDKSMDYFIQALESDIYDTQGGTTQEGIHTGVMGSSLDLFIRCFAGLSISEDRICLSPRVPEKWSSIKFSIRYKNIWFHIKITRNKLYVTADPLKDISIQNTTSVPIEIFEKHYNIKPGKRFSVDI